MKTAAEVCKEVEEAKKGAFDASLSEIIEELTGRGGRYETTEEGYYYRSRPILKDPKAIAKLTELGFKVTYGTKMVVDEENTSTLAVLFGRKPAMKEVKTITISACCGEEK
jgi:hypothetical protein